LQPFARSSQDVSLALSQAQPNSELTTTLYISGDEHTSVNLVAAAMQPSQLMKKQQLAAASNLRSLGLRRCEVRGKWRASQFAGEPIALRKPQHNNSPPLINTSDTQKQAPVECQQRAPQERQGDSRFNEW